MAHNPLSDGRLASGIRSVIVMFIDYHRIKKVPMDQALKNVE